MQGAQVPFLVRELDPYAVSNSLHISTNSLNTTTKDPVCLNEDGRSKIPSAAKTCHSQVNKLKNKIKFIQTYVNIYQRKAVEEEHKG